ncbi:hypothetical protein SAMN02927900_03334 [Rhizobium mongolense subsp. loessense]|uniref:Uncharacterized protein n=1 Tax=Rhizobium mongolense subsp. loessense TaxID=158890 RepID=A0A1G4S3G0_9HYPH|nr:hypothetical protein SAMN02927900_03334 [Rhizobium mongolense subsp. loessense]
MATASIVIAMVAAMRPVAVKANIRREPSWSHKKIAVSFLIRGRSSNWRQQRTEAACRKSIDAFQDACGAPFYLSTTSTSTAMTVLQRINCLRQCRSSDVACRAGFIWYSRRPYRLFDCIHPHMHGVQPLRQSPCNRRLPMAPTYVIKPSLKAFSTRDFRPSATSPLSVTMAQQSSGFCSVHRMITM